VFDNRVLRRTLGPKRNEMIIGWRKLHNEELHNLYTLPHILVIRVIKSRRIRWAEYVACMVGRTNLYRIFVGKPGRKRPLGRPRLGWVDNF
jgi:hypothetical protein